MKREEKNQQTRRRILDYAIREFAEQGYGASSVNNICSGEGISKGIIYHYFATKDELYLACVEECFRKLTEHMQAGLQPENRQVHEQLENYFNCRLEFFSSYPEFQRIFCEAVIMPPAHLKPEISHKRAAFDAMNISLLNAMIAPLKLRAGISREKVVDIFRQAQDYFNARYQGAVETDVDIRIHEEECRRALDILLYGVVDRGEV